MQMASNTHAIEVVVIDAPCVVKVVPYDAGTCPITEVRNRSG